MHGSCESFVRDQECCPGGAAAAGECGAEARGERAECGDPSGKIFGLLHHAFFSANHEVLVDIFKEKIRKAYGDKLEKAADAVVENAQATFQSMVGKGQAREKLREKLRSIFSEGGK